MNEPRQSLQNALWSLLPNPAWTRRPTFGLSKKPGRAWTLYPVGPPCLNFASLLRNYKAMSNRTTAIESYWKRNAAVQHVLTDLWDCTMCLTQVPYSILLRKSRHSSEPQLANDYGFHNRFCEIFNIQNKFHGMCIIKILNGHRNIHGTRSYSQSEWPGHLLGSLYIALKFCPHATYIQGTCRHIQRSLTRIFSWCGKSHKTLKSKKKMVRKRA